MRTLSTVLFLFISVISFAQCKYGIDETDKFTGKRKLETREQKAYATMTDFISVAFGKLDSTNYIKIHIGSSGDPYYVKKGDAVIILFSGGSKMTLKRASNSEVSDSNKGSGFWLLDVNFYLNESELFQIQNKLISGIRVYTSQGYLESNEIKVKFATKIKELANCI